MGEVSGKYQPYRELRFYPGSNVTEERKQGLADLAVEPNELTSDDVAWNLGVLWTRAMYTLMGVVRDRFGDEVANEVAEEFGYRVAKTNLIAWMRSHSLDRMTTEQFARFQDNRHALGGARHAESYISYDDEKLILRRTGCGYHDNRPEGHVSFCHYSAPGFFRGYAEVDPHIKAKVIRCRSRGDSKDDCEIHFEITKNVD